MLTIVNKKNMADMWFPGLEHIVPVYNAHPSYKKKETGQNPAHYATLNTAYVKLLLAM